MPRDVQDHLGCSTRTLATLVAWLTRHDYDVGAVLDEARLTLADLADLEHGRISTAQYSQAWEAAEVATGDPALGLHVLECFDLTHLAHLYVYLASACATPREAIERAAPYSRMAHERLSISHAIEGELSITRIRLEGFEDRPMLSDYTVGVIAKLADFVASTEVRREAWLTHAKPSYADLYEDTFGMPVRFGADCNAIVAPAAGFDSPLPKADALLCRLLQTQAEQALRHLPAPDAGTDFTTRVRREIERSLERGDARAEPVAHAMGISPRSLRRRLQTGGVRFQELLDAVRCERAREALGREGASIGDVADRLGFSDTSAFHKAFRRWTGMKPSEFAKR